MSERIQQLFQQGQGAIARAGDPQPNMPNRRFLATDYDMTTLQYLKTLEVIDQSELGILAITQVDRLLRPLVQTRKITAPTDQFMRERERVLQGVGPALFIEFLELGGTELSLEQGDYDVKMNLPLFPSDIRPACEVTFANMKNNDETVVAYDAQRNWMRTQLVASREQDEMGSRVIRYAEFYMEADVLHHRVVVVHQGLNHIRRHAGAPVIDGTVRAGDKVFQVDSHDGFITISQGEQICRFPQRIDLASIIEHADDIYEPILGTIASADIRVTGYEFATVA